MRGKGTWGSGKAHVPRRGGGAGGGAPEHWRCPHLVARGEDVVVLGHHHRDGGLAELTGGDADVANRAGGGEGLGDAGEGAGSGRREGPLQRSDREAEHGGERGIGDTGAVNPGPRTGRPAKGSAQLPQAERWRLLWA